MPRKYQRTTNKGNWTPDQLRDAILEISNGGSIRSASKEHGIPESTIRKKLKVEEEHRYKSVRLGGTVTFSELQEHEIAQHTLRLAKMFYGLNTIQFRRLAFAYAEANGIKHKFNKDRKLAGKDWYYSFMERHPNIALRKPEATSANRIRAFNEEDVTLFFSNLEELYTKYKFKPENIYNVDETGITVVQKPGKCLGPKGVKQLGFKTSAERGKNVTILCCCNAAGRYIAPMFIFPRKRMSDLLTKSGPTGALYSCSVSGWSNEELFLDWLKHFIKATKPSTTDPVLIVLDNHSSHISLPIYECCKINGVVLLTLPPHTSHRLQPLDLTLFGPLKIAYNKECDAFLRTSERITMYDIADIFNRAYVKVATMEKAASGFNSSGIFPFQPNKFTAEDFKPASQFRPIVADVEIIANRENNPSSIVMPQKSNSLENPQPSTSAIADIGESEGYIGTKTLLTENNSANFIKETNVPQHVTAETLSPIPVFTKSTKTRQKNKQKSIILTATPHKDELIEAENKRKNRQKEVECRNNQNKGTQQKKRKRSSLKRKLFEDSSSDDEDVNWNTICNDNECDDAPGVDENQCTVCGELPLKTETWYRCTVCSNWAHALCTGWDSPENYVCDGCDD